jgi:putative hemolysin
VLAEFLIILVLILVNGIFSGAEIAIVAMRKSRVRELAESGSRFGLALKRLRDDPERFLSTVQIGITVVGATAAAFGGAAFGAKLEPLVARIEPLAPHAEEISLALVVALVSFLAIVLGELVPKSLALRASERYAWWIAQPLLWLSSVVRPAVWLLTKSSNAVLLLFRDHTSFVESKLSLEELRGLVDEASQGGSVSEEAGDIASRALKFSELTAADVMMHRRFVIGLRVDAGPDEVRRVMLESGHRRTPVHKGSLDEILGYVSWRDVLQRVWTGAPLELGSMLRTAHFVPETTLAPELLETMRSQRLPLAIVVDEHGGTAGIVTLEDLLEELVGEIVSEHDSAPTELVALQPDGSALVPGTASIWEVKHALEIELPEPEEWTTMAGLCIELAGGRIPRAGERFTVPSGTAIEVVEATERRVRAVRVRPQRAAAQTN